MTYTIDENRPEVVYANRIISGEYLAGEYEILACKRFLKELEMQGTDEFPYVFDTTRGDRFFRFFEQCANVDATDGTLLKLAEFQRFDLSNLFSWVEMNTGRRRFRDALIFQARGQGKSTQCAVIELYMLCADKIYPPYRPKEGHFELNPSIVAMAVDREQTKFTRQVAMDIARRSPFLRDQVVCKQTYIRGAKRGGEIAAISKETGNLDGAKLNLIIADEFAAMKESKRIGVLRGSFGKREQSILIKITTAGDDCLLKPAYDDYNRCIEILNGRIKDDTYFVMIRQLDEKDNPADFSLYEKSMPMLREKNDYARRLLEQVKVEFNSAFQGGSEQQKIEYLIKRTNRWQVGSESKFLTQDDLEILQKSQVPKDEFVKMIKDHSTVVGIDFSLRRDLTATAFIFNLPDKKIGIYVHAFMPKDTVFSHTKTDNLPYEAYEKKGYITFTESTYVDQQEVMKHMIDFEKENKIKIKAVCADAAFCQQLLLDLDAGRTPNGKSYETIECPQTTAVLNEACRSFLNHLSAGELVICENQLFINHCANAYNEYDKGGRMKIAKKNHDSYMRIDLLAAVMNAIRKIDLLEGETLANKIRTGKFSF